MIYENSIIQLLHSDNKQNRLIRVCWISNDLQNLIVIDITDFKNVDFPYFVKMEDLLNDFEESRAKKIDFEPDLHIINPSEEYLMKYADKLNMKWKLIEELVSTEPAIYIPEERWKLLEELTAKTGVQANVIYDLLKRYWFYGKTINGLLPNYFDCGAKGESRHIFRLCLLFWRNQHGETYLMMYINFIVSIEFSISKLNIVLNVCGMIITKKEIAMFIVNTNLAL